MSDIERPKTSVGRRSQDLDDDFDKELDNYIENEEKSKESKVRYCLKCLHIN